jgi:N-acetylglutamate synthase (EC 2.3.1.1)
MTTLLYQPPVQLPRLNAHPNAAVIVRRARVGDVPRLYEIINYYAARGDMLPKTMDQLYNRVRNFNVAEADGEVVGCAALHITWADLAEVVSVAVHPDFQGRGPRPPADRAALRRGSRAGHPHALHAHAAGGFLQPPRLPRGAQAASAP